MEFNRAGPNLSAFPDRWTERRPSLYASRVHWGAAALRRGGDPVHILGSLDPWRVQPSGLARPLTHSLVWVGRGRVSLATRPTQELPHGPFLCLYRIDCSRRTRRQDPVAFPDSRHATAQTLAHHCR